MECLFVLLTEVLGSNTRFSDTDFPGLIHIQALLPEFYNNVWTYRYLLAQHDTTSKLSTLEVIADFLSVARFVP